jgi:hypothetical protein
LSVVNHNHHYQTLMHLLNDLRGFRVASFKDKAKGEGKAGVIQPQDVTPTRHSGGRFGEGPTTAGYGCRAYAVLPQNAPQVGFPQLLWFGDDRQFHVFVSKNATYPPHGSTSCTTNGAERMVSLT